MNVVSPGGETRTRRRTSLFTLRDLHVSSRVARESHSMGSAMNKTRGGSSGAEESGKSQPLENVLLDDRRETSQLRLRLTSMPPDIDNTSQSIPSMHRQSNTCRLETPSLVPESSLSSGERSESRSREHIHASQRSQADEGMVDHFQDTPLTLLHEWLWKTLVEPSILPLTIEWSPLQSLLHGRDKFEYGYVLSIPRVSFAQDEMLEVVKELVCQRMVMDYQVVVGDSDEAFMYYVAKKNSSSRSSSEREFSRMGLKQMRKGYSYSGATRCVLAKGDQYHELIMRPESQAVEVIRHVRKNDAAYGRRQYGYCLWSEAKNGFYARSTTFEFHGESVNWNKLDQLLVAGDDQIRDVTDDMCRKASFVLLPKRKVAGPIGLPTPRDTPRDKDDFVAFRKFLDCVTRGQRINVDIMDDGRGLRLPWGQGSSCWSSPLRYRVDMQPFRGDPNEWIIFSCDSFFSLESGFHIDLKWIVCDGNVVVDYSQMLQRKAKQLGFTLLPIPIVLYNKTPSAFEPCLQRTLSPLQALILHEALLLQFDFVLDSASADYARYIHIHGTTTG